MKAKITKIKRNKGVTRRRATRLQGMPSPGLSQRDRMVHADPLRRSVLERVGPAVRRLVEVSPDQQLLAALSTQTGMDALIYLVSADAAAAEVASNIKDPLRAARARSARKFSELLTSEGGPIRVEEVSHRLRITRAAVDKRRTTGTLIGIDDGGRGILYPSWQFTETGLLPGLDDALRAMTVADPWMRMQFFLSRDLDLGARPLDALRAGRVAEVVAAAQRFGRLGEDG
jgi:hypothetical protein